LICMADSVKVRRRSGGLYGVAAAATTFRYVATVRDGRKSVTGTEGKFWSVREREREKEEVNGNQ
jgi:hypothetical protein